MMPETITITHRITANKVATTVRMPGQPPMTKTWHYQDGAYILDNCNTWEDEESLPECVAEEADKCPTRVCSLLSDLGK
jgi:hypothetical protein